MSDVVPIKVETAPDAGKDPIRIMLEIAENKNISDQDKANLILYAQKRFTNRRRMAFVALYAIVASLAFLFIAGAIDGLSYCPSSSECKGILTAIEKNQSLITWIEGFLTSIVAAYYGVTAWRPAS